MHKLATSSLSWEFKILVVEYLKTSQMVYLLTSITQMNIEKLILPEEGWDYPFVNLLSNKWVEL